MREYQEMSAIKITAFDKKIIGSCLIAIYNIKKNIQANV